MLTLNKCLKICEKEDIQKEARPDREKIKK